MINKTILVLLFAITAPASASDTSIYCNKDAESVALWEAATTRQLSKDELLRALAIGQWLNIEPCVSYSPAARMNELVEILSIQAQELLTPSGRDIRPRLEARLVPATSVNVTSISGSVDTEISRPATKRPQAAK